MKIVQSLWSKPGEKPGAKHFPEINKCGWPDKKYNYISWALSCLQFRKYYDEVELVTDKAGCDLLVDRLGLPYTSVKVVLDDLNDYHPHLFALGKIYAYSIQDKPFVHADGDVYIWEKLPPRLENAPLVCQTIEGGIDYHNWYAGMFMEMAENFEYYPDILDESISKHGAIVAVNAGIMGGNRIDFFQYYTKEAFRFVDTNTRHLSRINVKNYNLIFEQFLFHALAEEQNIEIRYYNPGFIRFWNDISDFTTVPSRTKYIHTMGAIKKSRHTADGLEYQLQSQYPDDYFRLMKLLRTNQI